MKNSTYFNIYLHYFIYFLAALLFSYFLDMSMIDDGLRHISFSANNDIAISWENVFPHSLFTSYDPWYLWHIFLEFLLRIFSFEHIHIIINTISLFFLLTLVDYHFRLNIKYNFASITYILIFSIILLSSYRYVIVRPDLLSGLYILSMLAVKNKFMLSFVLTLIYGPFYYLFFVYTGSIGLVYIIKKEWKSFFGTFLGSNVVLLIFLFTNFNGYKDTVFNILTDQSLRMGLKVGEGEPLFSFLEDANYFILLPVFFICSISIIIWKYEYFKRNTMATFLLITSILWINQSRYFSLFLPIIILYLSELFFNSNKKQVLYKLRKYYTIVKRYVGYSKKATIFYLIAIPYSIFAFSYVFSTNSVKEEVYSGEFFKSKKFENKIILFNRMTTDIYKAFYFNPTVKIVPSCSIGWFDNKNKNMKDIYIRMQKDEGISEKELRELIDYIDADIYIHYLKNEKQVLDFDKLRKLGIIPEKIYNNRIIFIIEKKNE